MSLQWEEDGDSAVEVISFRPDAWARHSAKGDAAGGAAPSD
jgi:hypothetical protein